MLKQLTALTLLGIAAPVLPAQADLATQHQQAQYATYANAQFEGLITDSPKVIRYAIVGGKIWAFTRTHYTYQDAPTTSGRDFIANLNEVTSEYDSGCGTTLFGGVNCTSWTTQTQWKIEQGTLVRYTQTDSEQPTRTVMAYGVVPGAAANHISTERAVDLEEIRQQELKDAAEEAAREEQERLQELERQAEEAAWQQEQEDRRRQEEERRQQQERDAVTQEVVGLGLGILGGFLR